MGRGKQRNPSHRYRTDCFWCGAEFAHVQVRTECCSTACRLRLADYRQRLGWDPPEPLPGITARVAIAAQIARLIDQERARIGALPAPRYSPRHPCA